MDPDLIDLFVEGTENPLPVGGRLDGLGLGEGSVLFVLHRPGWCWTKCGKDIELSSEGLVATKTGGGENWRTSNQLVTGGQPMIEGLHYWEVELTEGDGCGFMIGAVRPGLKHNTNHHFSNSAYYISSESGNLFGNGKGIGSAGEYQAGQFAEGDRIGCLLDLDAGWLRFYRNGVRCGPGYTAGVTGPLLRAAQLADDDDEITVLPGAQAPAGAGAAGEEWVQPEPEPVEE